MGFRVIMNLRNCSKFSMSKSIMPLMTIGTSKHGEYPGVGLFMPRMNQRACRKGIIWGISIHSNITKRYSLYFFDVYFQKDIKNFEVNVDVQKGILKFREEKWTKKCTSFLHSWFHILLSSSKYWAQWFLYVIKV